MNAEPLVPARIMVRECERSKSKMVRVGTQWQRFSMTFKADHDFAWTGIGPDLKNADLDAVTLWIDAVQFEKADIPSDYQPRTGIESRIETSETGNTFLDPAQGISVRVAACNSTGGDAVAQGTLTITDFFDKQVHAEHVSLPVKAGENVVRTLHGLVRGRTGFFRVTWSPAGESAPSQNLRCMVIKPYEYDDSVFGMNHAYGWPFMLPLAKRAGLTWWRDWSVKWHEVEPRKGQFDFSGRDPQIECGGCILRV